MTIESVTIPVIPVIAVYNNLETFFKFLHRSNDRAILEKKMCHGDLGIFWLGPDKLLITTKEIPDAAYICDYWGYSGTRVVTPRQPTHQLSLDILNDPRLLKNIVEYAGPKKTIRLIPYASTPEFYKLVNHLRAELGLNVILSESPTESNLWIRDYIDTKTGFRSLIPGWLPEEDLLPSGFICRDVKQAARAVHWFNQQQMGAVVKADGGSSGIGQLVFHNPNISFEAVFKKLKEDLFLQDDLIIVDRFIQSGFQLSPSLELSVPDDGTPPTITYVSNQLFSESGYFGGVLISRELTEMPWYPQLARDGLQIATKLQAMGYVGHFDIDTIVDDKGHLYLLEINARRTGGTYVHEFASLTFGKDYLSKVSLLCSTSVKCGEINTLQELVASLDDLLFPASGQNRGVVITMTSCLSMNEFGCILVAPDKPGLLALKQEMLARLEKYSEKKIRV